jgi:threonine 3-dehydrogenase
MSGAPGALPSMIENMNHGGRIALLGLPSQTGSGQRTAIDWGIVVTHMLTLKGIYGREMFETWNAMGAMLQTSKPLHDAIASIVSDRFAARDWEKGFAAATADGGKVILDWTEL